MRTWQPSPPASQGRRISTVLLFAKKVAPTEKAGPGGNFCAYKLRGGGMQQSVGAGPG